MLWRFLVGGCAIALVAGIYLAQRVIDRRNARRKLERDDIESARKALPNSLGDSSGVKCSDNGMYPRHQESDSDLTF